MLSGWEGKRKSGVALAMCHGLQWFVRRKEDEPALLVGDTLYLYVLGVKARVYVLYQARHRFYCGRETAPLLWACDGTGSPSGHWGVSPTAQSLEETCGRPHIPAG